MAMLRPRPPSVLSQATQFLASYVAAAARAFRRALEHGSRARPVAPAAATIRASDSMSIALGGLGTPLYAPPTTPRRRPVPGSLRFAMVFVGSYGFGLGCQLFTQYSIA